MKPSLIQEWSRMVLAPLDGEQQVTGPHNRLEGLSLRVEGPSLEELRDRRLGGSVIELTGIDRTLLEEAAKESQ